jgi:catechol 2,3-dioxygenase-like lactoylglutathione lyase family enzyme
MANPIKREIGAVFLPVRDIEASRTWYCDLLGLAERPDILFGHICVIPMTDGSGFVLDSRGFVAPRNGTPTFHFVSDDLPAAFYLYACEGCHFGGRDHRRNFLQFPRSGRPSPYGS